MTDLCTQPYGGLRLRSYYVSRLALAPAGVNERYA